MPEPGNELSRQRLREVLSRLAGLDFSDSAPRQEVAGANVEEGVSGAQWHFPGQRRVWGRAQRLWRMRLLVPRVLINRDDPCALAGP